MKLLSTTEAAERLGVVPQLVRRLAAQGKLRGQKVGSDWVFSEREIARFKALPRVVGRPKKGSA